MGFPLWAAAAASKEHEPPVGLHSHLPALHGNLDALSCPKCQKSCLQLGPGILTCQQEGTAIQSYSVSSFLSCFYVGTGSHGSMCPDCVEIMAITSTLL